MNFRRRAETHRDAGREYARGDVHIANEPEIERVDLSLKVLSDVRWGGGDMAERVQASLRR